MISNAAETVHSLLPGHGAGAALVTVEGEALDHASLGRAVDRLCDRLTSAGIGPDDRVAIVLSTCD
ncbi:MAG: hypothetical protein ACYCUG_05375 [Acidimicrobiales bacterium]